MTVFVETKQNWLGNFVRRPHKKHFLNFDVLRKEIYYLDFWWTSCLAELYSLRIKFGRGHNKELVCENILNLDQ